MARHKKPKTTKKHRKTQARSRQAKPKKRVEEPISVVKALPVKAPDLVKAKESKEQRLISLLRSIKGGYESSPGTFLPAIARIVVKNGHPLILELRYPDLLNRQAIRNEPMTSAEQSLLNLIKFIKFGSVFVVVENGMSTRVLADTVQQISLDQPFDLKGWQG